MCKFVKKFFRKLVIILSKDFKLFDNKIIILYILSNSAKPLGITQIVKLCEEFDDITYIDICAYIDDLKRNNYINNIMDENVSTYSLTENGEMVLNELLELIPGVNLHNLKKIIDKNMTDVKKDYSVDTKIIPIKAEEYKVSCYIKDGIDELINITMYAGTKEQAKNISKNWSKNSEEIYTKILEYMTKDLED